MTTDVGRMVPWRRLGAELLVIVTGVMIALAADRWASARRESKQQVEQLEQLRADFVENREIAEATIDVKRAYAGAAEAVLAALTGRRDTTRRTPLPVAIELAGWNYEPHYFSNAWDDLLSTGDVELIRNRDLRLAISQFYRSVESRKDQEAEWRTYIMSYRASVTSVLDPYLRIRILDLYPNVWAEDSLGVRTSDAELVSRLRALPSVPGKLADVVMVNRTGAFFSEREVRGIDGILTMIGKELTKD